MKKINLAFLVIFLILGLATFFNMDKVNNKSEGTVAASETEKTKKAQEKSKFNYRGYEIDIVARFGKRDETTGGRYLIGDPEKSLQMFNVLTHDWKEVAIESKNGDDVSGDIKRINEAWNCSVYYHVVPEGGSEQKNCKYNSYISFMVLDKKAGLKGDFNTNQFIGFYDSQEAYERVVRERYSR